MLTYRRRVWMMRVVLGTALALSLGPAPAPHAQNAPRPGQVPFKETHVASGKFSLAAPLPAWVEPAELPDAVPGQPIVMRLVDTQHHLGETPVIFVRRALAVNDSSALASAGQIPISFVPDYQRLNLHSIRILRGSEILDRTQSSSIRFLEREAGLENGVYSGEVTASILVNDLRVGDTVDYAYSVEGQNPVFGGKFMATASWDSPFGTAVRRVVLNAPLSRQINWRFIRSEQAVAPAPRETTDGAMRKLVFEERAVAPVPPEPAVPADEMLFRALQFSEFADWREVAQWADSLFQVTDGIDGELRKVVETLRARPTEEERITSALEFVQSQIRYFSVSLGESSHRPAQPGTVFQRRYGDCKDKSVLLIALLKELGVEGRPVLLAVNSGSWVSKVLPSANAFNHVIVQVTTGGQAYWLDPTRLGQHGRLSRMGQDHQATGALLIAPDTRDLFTIASPHAADLSGSELSEVATLPKLGAPGELEVRQRWIGIGAETIRMVRASTTSDSFARSFSSVIEQRYPGATLIGEPKLEDDRVENVLLMTTRFQVPNLATEKDGNWIVRFAPTNMRGVLPNPPSATRRTAFGLPFHPYGAKYNFEVRFPEDVSAIRDPAATTTEDKHFTYSLSSSFRGNIAKVAIELKVRADRVAVADLPAFLAKKAALSETPSVVFVGKGDIKSNNAASQGDFTERLRARIQEGIDKTTETIKSGKLTGEDLAYAHCSRSLSLSYLGKHAEALEDANTAIKTSPNLNNGFTCRGFAQLTAGEFGKSIADYSKSISLAGAKPDPDNFRARGEAKFYLGRLEEAAEDFVKAGEASDAEARLYQELWLMWTLQRLGKPVPEAIAKRASEGAAGAWPRPALALLAGTLTPEQLLQGIEVKMGDEKQMMLAEGYFYLGQYYFIRGDKAKARDYFEKTRQQGVLFYTEHIASGFELQRMNAAN